jgi:hypothetical protein
VQEVHSYAETLPTTVMELAIVDRGFEDTCASVLAQAVVPVSEQQLQQHVFRVAASALQSLFWALGRG